MTFQSWWCEWTHGGGQIERDDQGRLNWRCAKCGRWHDDPVPLAVELARINADLAEYLARRDRP